MNRKAMAANVEVYGSAIQSLIDAMEYLKLKAHRILAAHGIHSVDPASWYPLHGLLASYQDILEQVGPSTVHAIGRHVPKNALFPSGLHSFESALRALDEAYRMNHRGEGDIGGYHYEQVGARTARMHCDNLYPCPFDQGILQALYERFQPRDSVLIRIEHAAPDCRLREAGACVYELKW